MQAVRIAWCLSCANALITPPRVILNDGSSMPSIGLGGFIRPQRTYAAVRSALALGYRLIDTAQAYENEVEVGAALRDFLATQPPSGVTRSDIIISTKLRYNCHGFAATTAAVRESCTRLDVDHIDRVLIHTPHGGKIVETYDALLQLQQEGVVRSVGVSNFDKVHLDALAYYDRPPPVVNQIEMHPLLYAERMSLVEHCTSLGIHVESFCPLLNARSDFWAYGTLPSMAAATGLSPAQLLLRWALQRGLVAVPKSETPERQAQNLAGLDFELSPDQMAKLEAMEGFRDGKRLVLYPGALDAPLDVGSTRHFKP